MEREKTAKVVAHHIWRCLLTVRKTSFQLVSAGSTPASAIHFGDAH